MYFQLDPVASRHVPRPGFRVLAGSRRQERPAQDCVVTHRGQFQWTCLPFGVANGPGTFTLLMNLVLRGLNWKHCLVYLDDLIVMSGTFEEHLFRLRSLFERLQ